MRFWGYLGRGELTTVFGTEGRRQVGRSSWPRIGALLCCLGALSASPAAQAEEGSENAPDTSLARQGDQSQEPFDFFSLPVPEDPERDRRIIAEQAESLISRMKDEEILAQTLMFGWLGSAPSPLILDWITKRHIGGVKVFGWNTEDTKVLAKTIGQLQSAAIDDPLKIPLIVATDQEGGWIRHVKGDTSETPGAMAIGAAGSPRDAEKSGYYIGREIAALGINMNFAPAVDLFTDRNSTLIGPRAFGDEPVAVGVLGAAFSAGLRRAGVIATAKHFPGHGATDADSHGTLPRILIDEGTMWERELVPYRILAKEGVPAIMSGHLAFPLTPGGEIPASLSPYFLQTVLRERLHFEGLVITDDLMMIGAVSSAGSLPLAAMEALRAGNDVLLVSKTPDLDDALWTTLLKAYRSDSAFRARVLDAAKRVLELKLSSLRGADAPPLVPQVETVAERVPDKEGQSFFLDLACRSVTRVYGNDAPFDPGEGERVLLAGCFEDFLQVGLTAYPKAETYRFSYISSSRVRYQERAELERKARNADTIIFCLANGEGLDLLKSLRGMGKRIIVLSVLSPVYLEKAPWVDDALAIYSYSMESFQAGFSALRGLIPADGVLPYRFLQPVDGVSQTVPSSKTAGP